MIIMSAIPIEKSQNLSSFQKACAKTQDRIMESVFGNEGLPDAVLHGGALGWRVHGSGRFSCDIDLYSQNVDKQMLTRAFDVVGLNIVRFRDTGNVIYAKLADATVGKKCSISDFEIMKLPVEGEIAHYTKVDGTTIPVIAISSDAMVKEKMLTYSNRTEMRDIYDIYYIITKVIGREGISTVLANQLSDFLAGLKRPANEGNLGERIYSGNAPSFKQMTIELAKAVRS